jgi:DNA-binding response OmpR family regulator
MKARVVIIEDIKEMSDLIAMYLSREGLDISAFETAEAALADLEQRPCDLLILDLNLPGMDGFEFLHNYRRSSENVPIIIVSARNADEDIITGLGYGADEYVTKPFSPKVLAARVRAILRRKRGESQPGKVFTFGPYSFDRESCILKKNNERLALSTKEFGVLAFLISVAGKPQSPEKIYGAVWGNSYGDLTTVAVYIQRLRKKIEEDPANPEYLETVHGMGYRFNLNTGPARL